MTRLGPTARSLLGLAVVLGLLFAVNFVPPDSSLAQVREAGVLRVCVPSEYPPLVTRDVDRPGVDVELLELLAADLGVRLSVNRNSAMGRDFNPRNWRVTRAQCSMLAGGVVETDTTRSFLETTPTYLETGWAIVSREPITGLDGASVGYFAGLSGLDRIPLSRFLRDRGAMVTTLSTRDELVTGLRSGRFDAGVTEALGAQRVAEAVGGEARWLPDSLRRYRIVMGLWKGDLSLKRAIVASFEEMRRSGEIEAILERYAVSDDLAPCVACEP